MSSPGVCQGLGKSRSTQGWELQGEASHPSSGPEEGTQPGLTPWGQHSTQAQEAAPGQEPILGMGIPAEQDTGNAAVLQC